MSTPGIEWLEECGKCGNEELAEGEWCDEEPDCPRRPRIWRQEGANLDWVLRDGVVVDGELRWSLVDDSDWEGGEQALKGWVAEQLGGSDG